MALNSNHTFEDLGGVKCSIIEKAIGPDRAAFLKSLLEFNGYTVVVEKSPPPKVAPAPEAPPTAETFTLGVTDYLFNATHAIYGKQLKTPAGHIVDMAYWKQELPEPKEGELYWKP